MEERAMIRLNSISRVLVFGTRRIAVLSLALACLTGTAASGDAPGFTRTLKGMVEGDGVAQPGYEVSLYASYSGGIPFPKLLGTDTTDGGGNFKIEYRLPPGLSGPNKPVLYVLAEKHEAMLASAIGDHDDIVVNELTTVAIGTAFAQFIDGREITGNTYGMLNAVKMAANMANPKTGAISEVLDNEPNGADTSTRMTFYSMANIVAACVEDSAKCDDLFDYATPKNGGPTPMTVLQAIANMTKYPSKITITDATGLFGLSLVNQTYIPALDEEPTSWLLFIKFTGVIGPHAADYNADNLMSGPGQIGFDERGFAWITDNYAPSDFDPAKLDVGNLLGTPSLDQIGCAGLRVLKFYPSGEPFPPYFGGGLSGAGFGIALDPGGKIWVGNFGFESPFCADGTVPADPAKKIPATHDSVSLFLPNGTPISGPNAFTEGHIWWPQGMASDKSGNIWIGNCGNDTVTLIPHGEPSLARNIAIPGGQGAMGNYQQPMLEDRFDRRRPLIKPFGLALDPKGRAWVVGNAVGFGFEESKINTIHTGGLYRISKQGTVVTIAQPHDKLLSFPMGIAGDSKGNMWVTNSDHVSVPCVTPFSTHQGGGIGPSLVYFPADSSDASGAQVFGLRSDTNPNVNTGGLTIPWGNFVDGNDTVWVFNFGVDPTDDEGKVTPLSHFCGADTSKCPAGLTLGEAISPPTGYVSNALDRVTGGGVDRSGNIWILNNWKKLGPLPVGPDYPVFNRNPGGNSFVIVPGAAAPIKTPLLGPPESFDNGKRH
jgi:hypothetical protein